ncbi:FKBP-type peptidyl-prolyl cis-trans isomerase [Dactylosporangium roseum]|uniref:FKBP-type peptidyl-prolyl cis-trans isomerase n=1 Tax=Dactylosporangium roseum TaxID=47989 RepID=UPI0021B227AC|nr:FKBP-type peptidyl-prolyl cis-trans isomerase [Dactylosporangium roseum]
MSDRGRSRRTARPTKATRPKAAPATSTPEETTAADAADGAATEAPAGGVTAGAAGAESDTSDSAAATGEVAAKGGVAKGGAAGKARATTKGEAAPQGGALAEGDPDPVDAADAADVTAEDDAADEDAVDEAEGGNDGVAKDAKDKGKDAKTARNKAPAPLTKAEKRAAARVAAAKAAKRRRVGQAFAGTLIVLLAVGGAFAGVWYFGDRAEEKRVQCKPQAQTEYPPLLGGFDKRLATEPTVEAGTGQEPKVLEKKVLIEGPCKTVKPGQTVTVNYVGVTFKDGKMFDSSWSKKQTFDTEVGLKQQGQQPRVIEGWDEGLVGVKVGSRVQLDIPPKLAYGETPPQGAPAGTLRFIVDILDAKDANSTGGLPGGLGN